VLASPSDWDLFSKEGQHSALAEYSHCTDDFTSDCFPAVFDHSAWHNVVAVRVNAYEREKMTHHLQARDKSKFRFR
jgi:hypothetical protein